MSKLSEQQTTLLRLILRSKIQDDGWYRVSEILWPHIEGKLPDDLAEIKPSEEGGFIRLTERGKAVTDYL